MAKLRNLGVYCGSSRGAEERHVEAAAELGRLAAERGVGIVVGGGRVGRMGALADAALAAGGRVTGIIPEHLMVQEVGHEAVTELEVVPSMHLRKMRMCALADAFCVLPGGFGTLDEAFEIITWKQLGLHDKPVVLANLQGFWDPLLDLVAHQVEAGFVRPGHSALFRTATSAAGVFQAVAAAPEPVIEVLSGRA